MNPNCPKCQSEYVYSDGSLWICPTCTYEWSAHEENRQEETSDQGLIIKDAFGNILKDGDAVTVIKDLKVKGSSSSVKVGTKVKNVRLVESDNGHNIDCKIDGFGAMSLKSEFVKKA